jgi:ATP-dependent DNA ligase
VKFDGYRCLAGRDSTGVTLWSRRGNLFTRQFPNISRACEQLPPGTLTDGEIVALDESGRISINLLGQVQGRPGSGICDRRLHTRQSFDALIVGYCEGEQLLYAAKVRNGFVPQVRREVAIRLKGLEIKTCPFANLPERKRTQWALTKEMKNCVWLKPELVAQIEFTEWSLLGHPQKVK